MLVHVLNTMQVLKQAGCYYNLIALKLLTLNAKKPDRVLLHQGSLKASDGVCMHVFLTARTKNLVAGLTLGFWFQTEQRRLLCVLIQ